MIDAIVRAFFLTTIIFFVLFGMYVLYEKIKEDYNKKTRL